MDREQVEAYLEGESDDIEAAQEQEVKQEQSIQISNGIIVEPVGSGIRIMEKGGAEVKSVRLTNEEISSLINALQGLL